MASFRLAAFALAFASLTQAATPILGGVNEGTTNLMADSPAGRNLLKKAMVVKPSEHVQHLRQRRDAEGQNQYNYDNGYGIDGLESLYIQYYGCSSFLVPDQEEGGGGESGDGNGNGNGNGNQKTYYYQQLAEQYQTYGQGSYNDGLIQQGMVLFTLCKRSSCTKCAGEYAIDMREFLDAYTEMKMAQEDYQCEYVREHCYCSSGYYESCLSTCYANAGLDNCMQQYYGGEAFQLQEYIDCSAAFGGNNGGRDLKTKFYVGPYCSSNEKIYLGAFYDESCTYQADTDTFNSQNYGDGFPYMSEPILAGGECLSCLDVDQDADDDQYQATEVNDLCQRSAEESIKCDSGRGYSSGCYFMHNTLPCLDGRGCTEPEEEGSSSGFADMSTSELYQEMAKRLKKNKRIAIIMGSIAGALLLAMAGMCMCCCYKSTLLQTSKKNPLLQKHQRRVAHAQKATTPSMQQ